MRSLQKKIGPIKARILAQRIKRYCLDHLNASQLSHINFNMIDHLDRANIKMALIEIGHDSEPCRF